MDWVEGSLLVLPFGRLLDLGGDTGLDVRGSVLSGCRRARSVCFSRCQSARLTVLLGGHLEYSSVEIGYEWKYEAEFVSLCLCESCRVGVNVPNVPSSTDIYTPPCFSTGRSSADRVTPKKPQSAVTGEQLTPLSWPFGHQPKTPACSAVFQVCRIFGDPYDRIGAPLEFKLVDDDSDDLSFTWVLRCLRQDSSGGYRFVVLILLLAKVDSCWLDKRLLQSVL